MIAVDTNVLVRLLTEDDPRQAERVRVLFETEIIFLPKTVLLETGWVLRRLYHLGQQTVIDALDQLISLPNVQCEDEPAVRQALDWTRAGLDFADAFHLASCRTTSRFASFDRRLIRVATKAGIGVFAP